MAGPQEARGAAHRNGGAGRKAAVAGNLTEKAETMLRQLFSVQGSLSPAQAAAVASKTGGCTADEAQDFFLELHAAAKKVIRRAVKRAAAAAANGAGSPAVAAAAPDGGQDCEAAARAMVAAAAVARQAASSKLQGMLDAGGGLRDATATGQFVSLMAVLSSSILRCQAAVAVASSRQTIQAKLVATAGFLTILEGWLEAATQGKQYSLLRGALLALTALPLKAPLVRSSVELQRAVRSLKRHKHAGVAAAASRLHQDWQQQLLGATGGEPVAAAAAAAAAAGGRSTSPPQGPPQTMVQQQRQQEQLPSGQLALASGSGRSPPAPEPDLVVVAVGRKGGGLAVTVPIASRQQPAVRGYQSLPAAASRIRAAAVQRPMSADDIRRQQERQRQQAQLQAVRQQETEQQQPAASQQQASRDLQALRSSALFKKLRMSIAAAKAASGSAPSRYNGATRDVLAAGETVCAAADTAAPAAAATVGSRPRLVAATPALSGTAENSELQRFEFVQSAHTSTGAASNPLLLQQQQQPQAAAPAAEALPMALSPRQPPPPAVMGQEELLPLPPPLQPPPVAAPPVAMPAYQAAPPLSPRVPPAASAAVPEEATTSAATVAAPIAAAVGSSAQETRSKRQRLSRWSDPNEPCPTASVPSPHHHRQQQQQQPGRPVKQPQHLPAAKRARRDGVQPPAKKPQRQQQEQQELPWSLDRDQVAPMPAAATAPPPWQRRQPQQGQASGAAGMVDQTAWRLPVDCEMVLPESVRPPAFGEESTEVAAIAAARLHATHSSMQPLPPEPLPPPAACEYQRAASPAVLPYVPADVGEQREQEELLQKGGWRPPLCIGPGRSSGR